MKGKNRNLSAYETFPIDVNDCGSFSATMKGLEGCLQRVLQIMTLLIPLPDLWPKSETGTTRETSIKRSLPCVLTCSFLGLATESP